MARGKKQGTDTANGVGMPRFVDVALSAEDKAAFLAWSPAVGDIVAKLSALCDDGYRVGCSWSGETQAYTVSLTCRDPQSDNKGLCMTSFARDLATAVKLAVFKHEVMTGGVWLSASERDVGEFG